MKSKTILLLGFLIFASGNVFAQKDTLYAPGRILIDVPNGYFDFPLEVYGAYISSGKEKEGIQIDSVLFLAFKPNSRIIENEKIINYDSLFLKNPLIYGDTKLNFSQRIIGLLKKYHVYLIKRNVKTFSPLDTIPHFIRRRDGKDVLVTRPNYNKYLVIEFDKCFDPKKVAEDFAKLPDITSAQPDYIITPYEAPKDPAYQLGYQFYMDPTLMNFEDAWSIIKGENGLVPITIVFIDHDFTNCNTLPDLAENLNTNGPNVYFGTGETGHGTEVTSIACAVTNNNSLIAGATWNCQFMPFVAYTTGEVVAALEQIRDYLTDPYTYNDCYVVNLSFGASNIASLENICNELYNDYWVLLVAAVANDGSYQITYPAAYSSVIGVAASNLSDDALFSFSNWGNDVELVATGESVYHLDYTDPNGFTYNWGTSIAAPFVSGLSALILSTDEGFFMSPDEIRNTLQSTAHSIFDHGKTFYRIDAYAAINDITTGIEDEVVVSGPVILNPNNYTFWGSFIDYPPLGNHIVGQWNWQLEARLTNGMELLDSGSSSGSYSTTWNCTVPCLDPNRNWVKIRIIVLWVM